MSIFIFKILVCAVVFEVKHITGLTADLLAYCQHILNKCGLIFARAAMPNV